MKLKILVAPIVFIASIVLSIWYIKPTFTEWGLKKDVLASKKRQLVDMQDKNEKVAGWRSIAEQSTDSKNVIFDYVPQEIKEEEMLDNLNLIATASQVILNDVEVKKVLTPPNSVAVATAPLVGVPTDEAVVDEKLVDNRIEVTFNVFGEYAKIKDFLNKVYAFKRFNEINSFNISTGNAQTTDGNTSAEAGAEETNTGLLKAEVSVFFNYAKGDKPVSSVNDGIFNTNFDMSVADSIKNSKNIEINDLNVGQSSGRDNPFTK